jgi:hypothetical protein
VKAVSLDTNLLVLYCIGIASERYISTNKRVANFSVEDFRFISDFLTSFDVIVSTPYSLAEVSNLLNVSSRRTSDWMVVEAFVEVIKKIDEIQVSSKSVILRDEFADFGLSDCAWLEYLDARTVFVSTDEALVNFAQAQGKQAQWFKPSKQ